MMSCISCSQHMHRLKNLHAASPAGHCKGGIPPTWAADALVLPAPVMPQDELKASSHSLLHHMHFRWPAEPHVLATAEQTCSRVGPRAVRACSTYAASARLEASCEYCISRRCCSGGLSMALNSCCRLQRVASVCDDES